jgi:hypothetical protein
MVAGGPGLCGSLRPRTAAVCEKSPILRPFDPINLEPMAEPTTGSAVRLWPPAQSSGMGAPVGTLQGWRAKHGRSERCAHIWTPGGSAAGRPDDGNADDGLDVSRQRSCATRGSCRRDPTRPRSSSRSGCAPGCWKTLAARTRSQRSTVRRLRTSSRQNDSRSAGDSTSSER